MPKSKEEKYLLAVNRSLIHAAKRNDFAKRRDNDALRWCEKVLPNPPASHAKAVKLAKIRLGIRPDDSQFDKEVVGLLT